MQRQRNNDYGESSSSYEPANEQTGTPHDIGSPKPEQSHLAEMNRRAVLTPHSSTSDKYRRTTPNPGSARRIESQSEECKRKPAVTPSTSTPEKIRRTAHGGRFVNSLIEHWVKNTGSQVSMPQPETPGDSSMEVDNEQHGQDYEAHKHALRTLKKKFQDAQETIMQLHVWRENELKLKDEIVAKINSNWESMDVITKFSDYVRESLTVFQKKYDRLSALYNDVTVAQRATIQKLKQKLERIESKGSERQKAVTVMEERLMVQEQQMVELQRDMKKQVEEAENKLRMTKSQLENANEENLKLAKDRRELMLQVEKSESTLRKIEESSKNIKEEITDYKSKVDDLIRQNSELMKNVNASELREKKLAAELESKTEELNKLEEHLTERRKIEVDLSKDLDVIGSKYANQVEEYNTLQRNFNEIQQELEDLRRSYAELEASTENMKTNIKTEAAQFNKQIETLKKEYEDAKHAERKNEELQNLKRTKEYNAMVTALQDTITKQYSDLTIVRESSEKYCEEKESLQEKIDRMNQSHQAEVTKLKEFLDKSDAVNQSLQKELSRMKENNEQWMSLQNMMKANTAKSATDSVHQSTRNFKPKSPEHQAVKEEKTSSLKPSQQVGEWKSAKTTRQLTSAGITRQNNQGRKSLSQPTGSQKKVRFNVSSPEQDSRSVDMYTFSPTTDDVLISPKQVSTKDEKSEKPGAESPNYKFFKSKGAATKQYGSARKARGRK